MIKQLLFVALLATTAHFMLNSAPAEKPSASNNPFRVSFPVVGKMQTAHGNQRIPFYMDSGVQNLVTAEISRTAAEAMLKRGNGQYDYQPVLTRDGKAIVTLWIMKYGMTTCGAYQEVVVTLSVCQLNSPLYCDADYSAESGAPEDLVAATLAPGVHNFADWLYLDQPLPISYGRDIFGTRKHQVPMESQYDDREDGSAEFRATHEGELLLNFAVDGKPSVFEQARSVFNFVRAAGVTKVIESAAAPQNMILITPGGVIEGYERPLHCTAVMSGTPTLQRCTPDTCRLELGPKLREILGDDFAPAMVTRIWDGQFVMFPPFDFLKRLK